MKYTIYEYNYVGTNCTIKQYFYGSTGNNDFIDQPDFIAVGVAATIKEAKKIIKDLGEIIRVN